jgi:hypothetical protein
METTIRNLITGELEFFVNDLSPAENIISLIIFNKKQRLKGNNLSATKVYYYEKSQINTNTVFKGSRTWLL